MFKIFKRLEQSLQLRLLLDFKASVDAQPIARLGVLIRFSADMQLDLNQPKIQHEISLNIYR